MPCELCLLLKKIEDGKEEPNYSDSVFTEVYCATHTDTPMAVLNRHMAEPTLPELEHINRVMSTRSPDRRARETGMSSIHHHWHEHWIPKEAA